MAFRLRTGALISTALCQLVLSSARPVQAQQTSIVHLSINDSRVASIERRYLLYVPAPQQKPMHGRTGRPLLIFLHGAGGNAEASLTETRWDDKAKAAGFILAVPEASSTKVNEPTSFKSNPQTWNDGSQRFGKAIGQTDDCAFIRAMIEDIEGREAIDPKRIYASGFSNGASMTFRVGIELADKIAAIAPVAGACWIKPKNNRKPVPMLYITGSADPFNPLAGGIPQAKIGKQLGRTVTGKAKPPVAESVNLWTTTNGASLTPEMLDSNRGVSLVRYGNQGSRGEVIYCEIDDTGHTWPGGKSILPDMIVGKTTNKVKANDLIWSFFMAHPAN